MYGKEMLHINGNFISVRKKIWEEHEEFIDRISDEEIIYKEYGMDYGMKHESSPLVTETEYLSRVILRTEFRNQMVEYVQRFINIPTLDLFRGVKGSTDGEAISFLKKYPFKIHPSGRGKAQKVASLLAQVGHRGIESYLDFGTGSGDAALILGRMLNVFTQGVDVYEANRPIPTYVTSSSYLPSEWENGFDIITSFSVLHHVKEQDVTLGELYRILRPGGILVIREHDYHPDIWDSLHAVHVVGKVIDRDESPRLSWALYRPMYQWDEMIRGAGFRNIYMSRPGDDMQRMYIGIYRKPPDPDTTLIVEYVAWRDTNLEKYFPKLGFKKENPLPPLRPGVNYDEEALTYMTPWYDAMETSKAIISSLGISGPRDIVDGTGGIGGNLLAFINNSSIRNIYVYERSTKYYNYMLNTLTVYYSKPEMIRNFHRLSITKGKVESNIYLKNMDFPASYMIQEGARGKVVFLDVPWIQRDGKYLLEGYTLSDYDLKSLASGLVNGGAIGTVLKLPPGYKLRLRHERINMNKFDLIIVKRGVGVPQAKGHNLRVWYARWRHWGDVKDLFTRYIASSFWNDWFIEQLLIELKRSYDEGVTPRETPIPTETRIIQIGYNIPSDPYDLEDFLQKHNIDMMSELYDVDITSDEAIEGFKSRVAEKLPNPYDTFLDEYPPPPEPEEVNVEYSKGILKVGKKEFHVDRDIPNRRYIGDRKVFPQHLAALMLRYDYIDMSIFPMPTEYDVNIMKQHTTSGDIRIAFAHPLWEVPKGMKIMSMFGDDRAFGSVGTFFQTITDGGVIVNIPYYMESVMDYIGNLPKDVTIMIISQRYDEKIRGSKIIYEREDKVAYLL